MPKSQYNGTFDLSQMASAPPVKKDSGIDLTQFKDQLTTSWQAVQRGDTETGRVLTVPTVAVPSFKSRFINAAKELGIGVAFKIVDNGNDTTTVTVMARTRKDMSNRAPRGSKSNGAANSAQAASKPAGGLPKAARK